ncbi:NDP-hexose 3,5-(Or5-) epimerase [Kibdelosporangium banguiense]|uniref:NDP-hexose 3,5-(Or5-) epimerase n=1 Tax=Kibdelosporangium banguiense TaxID=1365924 RepID=A0ABS4TXF0_9PSEU|nr:dTDP-4-dehydrorhamnose 3,5-epimerase [Kibdelosporangium banguiense]MBP2329062.1 NDP-hexose 3,5-(Or5-) epimerase [Kibdelosporangium banguiense]
MPGSLKIVEMTIPNAYRLIPEQYPDRRGSFHEGFRADELSEVIGYPFVVGQANYSVSCRDTVRGIHGTLLPPGQAKLVTCIGGAVMDVAVDLRIGSPTFGQYDITYQDEDSGIAVYLADGLGHAFHALTDGARMNYLCSEEYVPGTMLEINPLDPDIGIPWKLTGEPIMSQKDGGALGLKQAEAAGLLPTYEQCLAHYAALKANGPSRSAKGIAAAE